MTQLPATFWVLWTGFLASRLGLLAPGFLALYLADEFSPLARSAALGLNRLLQRGMDLEGWGSCQERG